MQEGGIETMENVTRKNKIRRKKKTHAHPKWVVWQSFRGTVLFVLSDPVMHFSLSVYEGNQCRPLKTTYNRSERVRRRYFSGWLNHCLYAEVTAGP